MSTELALNEQIGSNIAQHFVLVPKAETARFINLVHERYENYINSTCLFLEGAMVPRALDVFLYDISSYHDQAPFYDMMFDCVAHNLSTTSPNVYPEPGGDYWDAECDAACHEVIEAVWTRLQSELVHDIEVILLATNFVFVDTFNHRVINNPIVEVW